jgi:hypothetical protein
MENSKKEKKGSPGECTVLDEKRIKTFNTDKDKVIKT